MKIKRVKKIFQLLLKVSVIKTVYFSLRFKGLILMSRHAKLVVERGAKISLPKGGMLSVGLEYNSPVANTVIFLEEYSELRLRGHVALKRGVNVSLAKNAKLHIGENTFINEGSKIFIYKECIIGNSCAVSFDVIITDSDVHRFNGNNSTLKVVIEDNVWIGFRSSVIKGAHIKSGSVIACHSVVKGTVEQDSLAAGNPVKSVKSPIKWER